MILSKRGLLNFRAKKLSEELEIKGFIIYFIQFFTNNFLANIINSGCLFKLIIEIIYNSIIPLPKTNKNLQMSTQDEAYEMKF